MVQVLGNYLPRECIRSTMNGADKAPKLPYEIWLEIFKLACLDGRSGSALSLVCRLFYDLAKETRFHSVFVYGLSQLNALYSAFHKISPSHRRVHYFYFDMETHPDDSESSKKELAAYRSNRAVFVSYSFHNLGPMPIATLFTGLLSGSPVRAPYTHDVSDA